MAKFTVKTETKYNVFDFDKYEVVATFNNESDAIKYKAALEEVYATAYEKGKKEGMAEGIKEAVNYHNEIK